MYLFDEIIEGRASREQGAIDSGRVIIAMLTNFLKEGIWQYGLQRCDGKILTAISQWPDHMLDEKNLVWQNSDGFFEPIIWFGLKDESPIECWTLDRSSRKFDLLNVYDYAHDKVRKTERWHLFWFCDFWALDWNALFNNNGDVHIAWMFAECGMDEPSEEFYAVRDSCPIELLEKDTVTEILRKIDQLFIEKKNQAKTAHSASSN